MVQLLHAGHRATLEQKNHRSGRGLYFYEQFRLIWVPKISEKQNGEIFKRCEMDMSGNMFVFNVIRKLHIQD